MFIDDQNIDAVSVKDMMHIIVVLLCMLSTNGFAEAYYVSKDIGSDTNDGLSMKAPWRSLQKAIDSVRPGDMVTIKKSIHPYRQIVINKSGKENQPIIIQGESETQMPVITGGRLVTNWLPSGIDGVWISKATVAPSILTEDGVNLAKSTDIQCKNGKWFWSNNHIHYKPSASSPYNHEVWRSASAGGIKMQNASWVILKNLDLRLGKGAGVELKNSKHNLIENIRVKWHWQGVRIADGSEYNQISNAHVEENREGIYISSKSSNNYVKNCKSFRNGNLPFWSKGDRGGVLIGEQGPNTNNTIDGCEVAFNGGPDSDPALIAYRAPYTLIKNNHIHDNYGSGIFVTIWSNDSTVISNKVINNGKKAVTRGYKGISGLSVRRSKRVHVQDNYIINNYVSPDSRWTGKDLGPKGGLDLQGNSNDIMTGVKFINNTVSGTTGGPDFFISKVPATPGLVVK